MTLRQRACPPAALAVILAVLERGMQRGALPGLGLRTGVGDQCQLTWLLAVEQSGPDLLLPRSSAQRRAACHMPPSARRSRRPLLLPLARPADAPAGQVP